MSQIFKAGISGTPSVPTSFTTDQQDSITAALSSPNGTAVPQANVLRIGGDNGVATYQIVNQPGAMTIGFIRGGPVTTVNNASATILTQPTPTNSTTTTQILVAGYGSDGSSFGASAWAVINNTAGVTSLIGTVDFIVNASPLNLPNGTIANATLSVTTSGANFSVNVVGPPSGTITITWEACLPGIIIS